MSELDSLKSLKRQIAPVVLVKKTFPKARSKNKNRQRLWKLKVLEKETIDENNHHKKEASKQNAKNQRDIDLFMQDIEEDPELRQQIDIFKDEDAIQRLQARQQQKKKRQEERDKQAEDHKGEEEHEESKGNGKRDKQKRRTKKQLEREEEQMEEDLNQSVEEDFPEIKVEELKTLHDIEGQLDNMNLDESDDD